MLKQSLIRLFLPVLFIVTFVLIQTRIIAQPVVMQYLGRDSIQVGDSVLLTLKIETKKGAEIFLPQLTDTLGGGIELYDQPLLDTLQYDEKAYIARYRLPLVSYDTGWRAVPQIPLLVMYNGRADTIIASDVLLLHVTYVPLSEDIGELADIRGPLFQSITFRELLPWFVAAVVLLVIVLGIYFWLRYRRRKVILTTRPPKDNRPPKDIALALINELNQNEAWRTPGVKFFYTGLTDALRGYFAAIWHIRTLEETTVEIIEALRTQTSCSAEHLDLIQKLLKRSDLVKFAKFQPNETEARTDGAMAVRIVEEVAQQLAIEQKLEAEKSSHDVPNETLISSEETV